MTIKELYEYAKVNGFENLPFRYGYIDYDGICRLQDFYLPDYVLAYAKENGCTAGQVQGNALKVANCIVTAMQAVGKLIRDKHGDKTAVELLHNITMKALQLIYKDSDKE